MFIGADDQAPELDCQVPEGATSSGTPLQKQEPDSGVVRNSK
eukprot:XP_001707735.1 Hypothetical protein GL50803_6816 [Giardia lamblia ATCC 50803]